MIQYKKLMWGCSSAGRAPALQAGGQEFDSPHLHHKKADTFWCLFFYVISRESNSERAKSAEKVAGGKFFSFLMRSPVPKPKGLGGQAKKVCEANFFSSSPP